MKRGDKRNGNKGRLWVSDGGGEIKGKMKMEQKDDNIQRRKGKENNQRNLLDL